MNNKKKKKILFVGAFKKAGKDGSVGGQMFACRSLLNSPISEKIDWVLLDSTGDSNKNPSLFSRVMRVLKRLSYFFYILPFKGFDAALIFTSGGGSFLEKGTMGLISKMLGKTVIIAPRSGLIPEDYKKSGFMRWFIKLVIRKVDYVICQGEYWKDFYQGVSGSKDEKFVVIQNWLNAEPYFNIQARTPKTDEPLKILYLAWVNGQKGIFDFIDAAKAVLAKHKNVEFWVCGEGADSDSARAKVIEYNIQNYVDFKGWVVGEHKMEVLAKTDIYVLPSYFEGFPNALMEAMASRLPVIATTVGSIPDLVTSPQNGLLYEAGNVKALQDALETLIIDPEMRQTIAQKARETIRNNNTIDVALQKFDYIFSQLDNKEEERITNHKSTNHESCVE